MAVNYLIKSGDAFMQEALEARTGCCTSGSSDAGKAVHINHAGGNY
jgi:hypothetical protein